MLTSLFLWFTSLVSVTGSYTVDDCLYPKSLRHPQAINNNRSQLRNNTFFPVRFFGTNTLKGTTTSFFANAPQYNVLQYKKRARNGFYFKTKYLP